MPFVIQCPYCNVRARVPDRALGASGKCSRCHNAFTLVPADDQRVPELVGAPTDPTSSDLEPQTEQAANVGLPEVDPEADAAAAAEILRSAQEFEDDAEADEAEEPAPVEDLLAPSAPAAPAAKRARLRPETLAGAAALLLGGAALVCASFRLLAPFVWPTSAVGLGVGVLALALARRAKKKQRRLLLPIGGCVLALAVLTLALFFPALLGPTYALSRQTTAPAAVLRAVPLKGAPGATVAPDWVDAGLFALQRGDVRVQMVQVSLGPPTGAPVEKQDAPVKDVLQVRVRVQRTQLAEVKDREISSFEWSDERRPTLLDDAGRSYGLQSVTVIQPVGAKRRSALFPVSMVDEVLAFAPPPAGIESLRLELPGAPAIGGGVFRFTIPAAMIAPAKQPPQNDK